MTTTNPKPDPADAKAYVDQVLETMRRHGAQPKLRKDTYRRTVAKVSEAFDGLRAARGR